MKNKGSFGLSISLYIIFVVLICFVIAPLVLISFGTMHLVAGEGAFPTFGGFFAVLFVLVNILFGTTYLSISSRLGYRKQGRIIFYLTALVCVIDLYAVVIKSDYIGIHGLTLNALFAGLVTIFAISYSMRIKKAAKSVTTASTV